MSDKNNVEGLLRIRVLSHTGDKIYIKLPIDFAKKLIRNNALDFINKNNDIIDSNKLTNIIDDAFKYNLSGEIVSIKRKNGDDIRIVLD